jgi:hypothetical protein
MNGNDKSSAQLEREVEEKRSRLENDIDEIRRRLSPGQLLDEFVDYTRLSGGSAFFGNLSRGVRDNPLPVALTAVGLAWLMARSNATPAGDRDADRIAAQDATTDESRVYPYARIKGGALRRLRQTTDEAGQRYSEFADEAGTLFKATSDDLGNRAGHFADQAGTSYRGFTDEAGNRVSTFLDEAGAQLADAQGWAADTWDGASGRLGDLQDSVAGGVGELRRRASQAGGQLQENADGLSRLVTDLLRDQPLVGGAIAFAVGAALASALPPTQQEDELVGKASDELKEKGRQVAGDAYGEGKQQLGDAFEKARDEAAAVHAGIKDDLAPPSRPASLN